MTIPEELRSALLDWLDGASATRELVEWARSVDQSKLPQDDATGLPVVVTEWCEVLVEDIIGGVQ